MGTASFLLACLNLYLDFPCPAYSSLSGSLESCLCLSLIHPPGLCPSGLGATILALLLTTPPHPNLHLLKERGNSLFHSTRQTGPGFTSLYPTSKRIDSELSSHAAPLNIFSCYRSSTTWWTTDFKTVTPTVHPVMSQHTRVSSQGQQWSKESAADTGSVQCSN